MEKDIDYEVEQRFPSDDNGSTGHRPVVEKEPKSGFWAKIIKLANQLLCFIKRIVGNG